MRELSAITERWAVIYPAPCYQRGTGLLVQRRVKHTGQVNQAQAGRFNQFLIHEAVTASGTMITYSLKDWAVGGYWEVQPQTPAALLKCALE